MRTVYIIIILSNFYLALFGQKQEYYRDFDHFTKVINQVNPQLEIWNTVAGYNIMDSLNMLKRKIDKIQTDKDFYMLVNQALIFCQDGHARIIDPMQRNIDRTTSGQYLDSTTLQTASRRKKLIDSVFFSYYSNQDLQLFYLNGEYYNLLPYKTKNGVIEAGLQLTRCNGKNIHNLIQELAGQRKSMHYDYQNTRFYHKYFYNSKNFHELHEPLFIFKDKFNNKYPLKVNLDSTIEFQFLPDSIHKYSYINSMIKNDFPVNAWCTMKYYKKNKILYLKIGYMDVDQVDPIIKNIRSLEDSLPIAHIIIDIRKNFGGNDLAWQRLLENIIDTPIVCDYLVAKKNSEIIREINDTIVGNNNINFQYKFNFLNSEEYLFFESKNVSIQPHDSSISFPGKIALLVDNNIYSSACALKSLASYCDKIVSIGIETGRFGGRGITPYIFVLPWSKIVFQIEPVIDLTQVKNAIDCFHDEVEIPLKLSIDEYIDYYQKAYYNFTYTNIEVSEKQLIETDPFFRKALQINN